jgi:hypothetical protein
MTVEQAFATLGIPINSDESAISKAYHELSQLYHPDKPDGDAGRQAEINEAHETLMAEVSENRALVVIRNTQALHEVKALILSEQAARNAAKEVFAAKRRGVGPLHRMKTTAWVAGSVAAIATFIPDKILPMMPKNEADVFKPMLGMTAVMAAIIGGFFQFRATKLSSHIDEFSDEMDDPRNCAQALASSLKYEDATVITEAALRSIDVRRGPRNPVEILEGLFLPRFSYQVEHERLIQLKAIQHGLITAIPVDVVTPDSVPTFKVNFQPSSFRPKPAAPPLPDKPIPRSEAIGMTLYGGAGMTGLVGLAVYLGAMQHTWWAVLPAFFSLTMIGLFLMGVSSWIKAPPATDLPKTAIAEPPQETDRP